MQQQPPDPVSFSAELKFPFPALSEPGQTIELAPGVRGNECRCPCRSTTSISGRLKTAMVGPSWIRV